MIGKRLKTLREEKGLNMKQMAEALDMAYTTYVNYEKETREPSSDQLVTMARYFDVSTDFLLGCSDLHKSAASENEPEIDHLKFALYGTTEIDDEVIADVKKYAAYARYIRENKGADDDD